MDTLTRMRTFVQVVEAGGFSAAARQAGRSKGLISKYVREIEDELGARLLNRTTRQLSLTEAGETYYREAVEILRKLDDLQASISEDDGVLRGRIRISAPRTFGDGPLSSAIMEFMSQHPNLTLELSLEDRFVDLVNEGYDLAIRVTNLSDSSLIARKLASARLVTCAAPALIEQYGEPEIPSALTEMPCIIDANLPQRANWAFYVGGERVSVPVSGRVQANSPIAVRAAAVAGLGYARLLELLVRQDVEAGRLKLVLDQYEVKDSGIYAVYPHRRHLSAKVRALIDFLARWFQTSDSCVAEPVGGKAAAPRKKVAAVG